MSSQLADIMQLRKKWTKKKN